jgi:hypothetical protein
MKLLRIAVAMAVFLLCGFIKTAEIRANPSDYLIRSYTIELTVDDLGEALELLGTMPGIDLNSSINVYAGGGHIERIVANRDLSAALAVLHRMGQVTGVESQSRNVFAAVSDLRSEFEVRSIEHHRLMELLYAANTLAGFQRIEQRLVQVIADLENVKGRLNRLELDMGTARIHVALVTAGPEPESEPEPDAVAAPAQEEGPFHRIERAFMLSANASLTVLMGVLVALSYISVPLVAAAVGVGVWRFVVHKNRKGGGKNEHIEHKAENTEQSIRQDNSHRENENEVQSE